MIVKEMIDANNERRKLLNKKNKEYYEKMLIYLRLSPIPEKRTEELLLEILDHLLIAQQEGRSAEEVFGENPEAYCEELVQSMGKYSPYSIGRFLFIFGVGLYVGFLYDGIFRLLIDPLLHRFFNLPHKTGMDVSIFLFPMFMVFAVDLVMFFLRKSTFMKLGGRILWGYFLPLAFVYIVPLVIYYFFRDELPVIPLPAWMSLLIGVLLWIIHKALFKRVKVF
ncbi:DNA-binding ferritin-like protein (Dps family) [Aneurinibacillus thermoaerophilus]|uniref:DNA-binding ferritin-like protein (Dps family) n=1 Tax=Aneurinibacillus thermoaerophilus TaxID=143495 RepID=A0A1G7YD98_ANETH|nr:hypothetical protein ACH33_04575 [Aneurinibacillus sp. XH2]SDG94317.1 DNA-binding ferritin-like protein (Dps family) [Aneurinibacillus thermoaerophilus]